MYKKEGRVHSSVINKKEEDNIKTRYSNGIYTKLLTMLKQNEEKKVNNSEKEGINENKLLVFDTSSLNAVDFFSVISEYDIILTDIVRKKMENNKKKANVFGANIRKLFKKIAEDVEGRIQTAIVEEQEDGDDEKIVLYCKKVNATLYTGDNSQASYAKIQGVPYILANRDKSKKIGTHTVNGIRFQNNSLILNVPDSNRIHHIVIRDGKKLDINYIKDVKLQKDDIILILSYKKKLKGLGISKYTIRQITQEDYASFDYCYKGINTKSDIEKLDFNNDVKRDILSYLLAITQLHKVF